MKNIVLVGFMGTGKTEVAKLLAVQLGKSYVSTDELIEAREARVINDIFKDDGEAYFRKIEKQVVVEISSKDDQVVDTGGGVVLNSENIENLKKKGIIICLHADSKTIYKRIKEHGHRPLLNTENPEEKIKYLLDYRRPFYEKADFQIDTVNLDVAVVVEIIKEAIFSE